MMQWQRLRDTAAHRRLSAAVRSLLDAGHSAGRFFRNGRAAGRRPLTSGGQLTNGGNGMQSARASAGPGDWLRLLLLLLLLLHSFACSPADAGVACACACCFS